MSDLRERLRLGVTRARIARYQRRMLWREFECRAGQERLERVRAGIKGNLYGGNSRWA